MKHGSHVPRWGIYSEGGVSDPNNGKYTIEYYIKLKIDLCQNGSSLSCRRGNFGPPDSLCRHHDGIGIEGRASRHSPTHYIHKFTQSSNVMRDLDQFMISQDLSLEGVSDRTEQMAFPESVVQYLRVEIGAPPGGFS